MLYVPSCRWLIFTPPHVGSRALIRALTEQHGASVYLEACPDGSDGLDHHGVGIPNHYADCTRAIVVRNPYDRAVGLWHHLVWWNALGGFGCSDFAEFAAWLKAGRHPDVELSWLYLWPISKWLRNLRHHVALRYETLADDLRCLAGLTVTLGREPWSRAYYRKPWPDYYTDPDVVAAVTEWGRDDFALGGYVPGSVTLPAPRDF